MSTTIFSIAAIFTSTFAVLGISEPDCIYTQDRATTSQSSAPYYYTDVVTKNGIERLSGKIEVANCTKVDPVIFDNDNPIYNEDQFNM